MGRTHDISRRAPRETPPRVLRGPAAALALVTAALGCHGAAPAGAAPSAPASQVLAPSCPGARILAHLDDPRQGCDLGPRLPASWRGAALFEDGSPGVSALAAAVPQGLRHTCVFEWTGEGSGQDYAEALADLARAVEASPAVDLASLEADCFDEGERAELSRTAAVSSSPSSATSRPSEAERDLALRDAFRLNAGWVAPERLPTQPSPRPRPQIAVDVAVADTLSLAASQDPAIVPAHPHGEVVAEVIAELSCPGRDADCPAQLHPVLAMPRALGSAKPDRVRGGRRGTQSDVALAVYEAVSTWNSRREQNPELERRLVINLSLGWVDRPEAPQAAPRRALIGALEYAACQGALVFAAAGNSVGASLDGADAIGPLAPASFETLPAPSPAACLERGFGGPLDPATVASSLPLDGARRPLVYAVGGVDGRDRPLATARLGARPRLAALAANAKAPLRERGGALSAPFTGSSVAAAVASGSAALVWSYRPQLRPDEVVELLYTSGWPTGARADFGLEATDTSHTSHTSHTSDPVLAPPLRRMSACAALERACQTDASPSSAPACPVLDCPAQAPAKDGNLGRYHALSRAALPRSKPALAFRATATRPGSLP